MAFAPRPLSDAFLTLELDDVSTTSTTYTVAPSKGMVVQCYSVIHGALATADAVLTPSIGGTAITGGAITITQSGSAAGDVDSSTPSAANVADEGDLISVATNGASVNAVRATINLVFRKETG